MDHKNIISRLKTLTGKTEDQELAGLLGLKKANFSARKQRDSLLDVIAEWGIKNDVDLNYLLKGRSNSKLSNNFLKEIGEWLDLKNSDDERFKAWFEIQFESTFSEFKQWKEEKERTRSEETETQAYKVA